MRGFTVQWNCKFSSNCFEIMCIGESYESLKFLYRIPAQTIGKIVPETCGAIIQVLSSEYLKVRWSFCHITAWPSKTIFFHIHIHLA